MSYTRTPDARQVHQRAQEPPADAVGFVIGLTAAERERGSVFNFIRAAALDDRDELAYCRSISEQVEQASRRKARHFNSYSVPGDVTMQRRDLTKGSSTAAYLVNTGIEGFAMALDAASLLGRLPITRLRNLTGDATITRETIKGTAGWLSTEGSTIPDAQSTVGQIALTPKTISGVITVSRQLLVQATPVARAFVERALAVTLAEAVDRALLAGSGNSGEPLGLVNTSGIDTRAGTSFTYAMAAAMFRVASGWAGSDSAQWVAGVAAAEDLQTRERAAGSGFIADGGAILDAPLHVSRSVGDQVLCCMPWSQLWFANWGGLEISVDPMTYFTTGKVMIRALWSVDFGVERAESVAIATALT